jgi:hypothetical protein
MIDHDLLVLIFMTLLPLVPAFLLFKNLSSTAAVSGPLKGFKINLGGAIAGYFAVLLVIVSFFPGLRPGSIHSWTVSGVVKFNDEAGLVTYNSFLLNPETLHLGKNGYFTLTVYAPNADSLPTLQIAPDGYIANMPISLRDKGVDNRRAIELGEITLAKDTHGSAPTQAQPAVETKQ